MTIDADARRAARKAAFFHEAMEPAGSSSPHRARSMRIALLILGQARTLSDSLVAQSQRHFLLAPLAAQGSVDVLAVVSSRDDEALLHANYPNATIRTHEVHSTWEQYERYTIGLQMLIAAEASSGHPFDWVVRTRPDLLFYSRLSTPLASLDARAVHCRMRCSSFESTGGEFDLNMIPSENHFRVKASCTTPPSNGTQHVHMCNCRQLQCGATSVVMDDQMAIVPRQHAELYFGFAAGGMRSRDYRPASPEIANLCPAGWPWMACQQTAGLIERHVPILPASLPFTIARTTTRYGSNTRVDGTALILDTDIVTSSLGVNHAGYRARRTCAK